MEHPLVTVIVPVYNTAEYLPDCVRSIRAQTYPQMQILLVDDGSTDGSGALCDRFAREDARIRAIHQENSGVSAARNRGLEEAEGKYVYFVDSDDWAAERLVEDTVAVMEKDGYDLCAWGMELVCDGETVSYAGRWEERRFSFPSQKEKRRFLCRWILANRVSWSSNCQVFRLDKIRRFGLRFDPAHRIGEDLDFIFRYTACCQNMFCIPKPLYFYRQRGTSAMHTIDLAEHGAALLSILRGQERTLRGQPLFTPFYAYAGTLVSVFLWNFAEKEPSAQEFVRGLDCLKASNDWDWLVEQARLAVRNRGQIRRICGFRLGGQVNGLYRFIQTGNPAAYCRAVWIQRCYTLLREWKNEVLRRWRGRA